MLNKLKIRLTVLCSLITGAVLVAMAFLALGISENQLAQANISAFKNSINNIVYRLQIDRGLSSTWLAQTEAAEKLVIHIEDNGRPLSFNGSWDTLTDRNELIKEAQEVSATLGVDSKVPPVSLLEMPQVIFEQKGIHGERYLAGVTMILSQNGWQSVTMLRDMQEFDSSAFRQRLLFIGMVICGIALLFLCGWLVAGSAIKPIEKNMKRQVEFVAAASHELRSPLAVIQASAGAIAINTTATATATAADRTAPLQTDRFLSNIERECGRMGRLIDDLLLLAGSDAKTWSIIPHRIEPDTLLIDTVDMFLPVAAKNNQKLSLLLPDDTLPIINGDFSRLQQALSVLIDNALFYSGEGGKILVTASHEGKLLKISVADNGIGISPADALHIFDRFYRADKSRNDKEHFGLGLSIAFELIKLHHGKLYLDGNYKKGSKFVIELQI